MPGWVDRRVVFLPVDPGHTEATGPTPALWAARQHLMALASRAGIHVIEAVDRTLPRDWTVPVIFFEAGPHKIPDIRRGRLGELYVLHDYDVPGETTYILNGVVRPPGSKARSWVYSGLTRRHLDEPFEAWLAEMWSDDEATPARKDSLTPEEVHAAAASLEPTLGLVDRLMHDGGFGAEDEEAVTGVMSMLRTWSRVGSLSPRMAAAIIAELAELLRRNNPDPDFEVVRQQFIDAGAEEFQASWAAGELREALDLATELGNEDPERDGATLERLGEINDDLRSAATSPAAPGWFSRRFEEFSSAAASSAGKTAGAAAVGGAGLAVTVLWPETIGTFVSALETIARLFIA